MKTKQPDNADTLELKSFTTIEIKDEAKGLVEAIVATLGVIDKDFEVITATAIKDESKVTVSSYGHDIVFGDGLPAGKGHLYIEDDRAVFKGKMFLGTQRGRETFEVLKEMGADQQWSFGFRVLGSEIPDEAWQKKGARRILTKLDAFEVSPVLIGAGVGTRTVSAKAAEGPTAEEIEAEQKAALELAERHVSETKARILTRINAGADRRFKHRPAGTR